MQDLVCAGAITVQLSVRGLVTLLFLCLHSIDSVLQLRCPFFDAQVHACAVLKTADNEGLPGLVRNGPSSRQSGPCLSITLQASRDGQEALVRSILQGCSITTSPHLGPLKSEAPTRIDSRSHYPLGANALLDVILAQRAATCSRLAIDVRSGSY